MELSLEKKLKNYRLTHYEYQLAQKLLGRDLKNIEWCLFSALWSEHCSYKSSKVHLKKFAKTMNERVLNSSGENAGIIDLGKDEKIAFKMESHNHPSFIEPYQGAATGVGGILRDIFTMGARPIALADYLCFGIPTSPKMKSVVDGVVRGISGYGNCVGVPTITGQTTFHSKYDNNVLVNAMAVGLIEKDDKIALSSAKGVGNLVVYVGAKTGKDGVHGAAMASESFGENLEAKKPNIQVGDPYYEKLLIESCLEVIKKDLVVSIQDMGAAGLTSSSFEMSSKGQLGMDLFLDRVPTRDSTMTPEEILLSESQERMLLIVEPQKIVELKKYFTHWGLDAVEVGKLKSERNISLYWKGDLLTSIDPDILVENAPQYEREYIEWIPRNKISELTSVEFNIQFVEKYYKDFQGYSRKSIYRQYDQRVGLNTVRGCDHDVAVLKLPKSHRGLSIVLGCRPEIMDLDAQVGAYDSVVYPSLQMMIKGFDPIAITDCLNFGNPEKIDIMSEFVASVDAIVQSSIRFSAPVISGNVSFYNETQGKNIISTPAVGMIGLREDIKNIPEDYFQAVGSSVYLFELDSAVTMSDSNFIGNFNLDLAYEWAEKLKILSQVSGVLSTQMVKWPGLAISLIEMTSSKIGIQCKTSKSLTDKKLYQAIFEIHFSHISKFEELLVKMNLKAEKIGITTDQIVEMNGVKIPNQLRGAHEILA